MNIASWRSYQDAHYPTWRLMGGGLAIGNLLLTPFNFWFTLSLLRAGDLPELQIRILQGAHAYSALFASAFLLFAWITRGQSTPTRFGEGD